MSNYKCISRNITTVIAVCAIAIRQVFTVIHILYKSRTNNANFVLFIFPQYSHKYGRYRLQQIEVL
jgi:hypothetical protein